MQPRIHQKHISRQNEKQAFATEIKIDSRSINPDDGSFSKTKYAWKRPKTNLEFLQKVIPKKNDMRLNQNKS